MQLQNMLLTQCQQKFCDRSTLVANKYIDFDHRNVRLAEIT